MRFKLWRFDSKGVIKKIYFVDDHLVILEPEKEEETNDTPARQSRNQIGTYTLVSYFKLDTDEHG